jgi:hypothetical protein
MKTCKECNSRFGTFHGHIHPILGKKHIICNECYEYLEHLIIQWQKFVFTHPDYIKSLKIDGEKIKNNFQITTKSIMDQYSSITNNEHNESNLQLNFNADKIENKTKTIQSLILSKFFNL